MSITAIPGIIMSNSDKPSSSEGKCRGVESFFEGMGPVAEGAMNASVMVSTTASLTSMGVPPPLVPLVTASVQEITGPVVVSLERLNHLLSEIGQSPLAEQDYLPVRAA